MVCTYLVVKHATRDDKQSENKQSSIYGYDEGRQSTMRVTGNPIFFLNWFYVVTVYSSRPTRSDKIRHPSLAVSAFLATLISKASNWKEKKITIECLRTYAESHCVYRQLNKHVSYSFVWMQNLSQFSSSIGCRHIWLSRYPIKQTIAFSPTSRV